MLRRYGAHQLLYALTSALLVRLRVERRAETTAAGHEEGEARRRTSDDRRRETDSCLLGIQDVWKEASCWARRGLLAFGTCGR